MTIDQKIRESLETQAQSDEEILVPDRGLFGMLANAFNGSMRRWVWLSNILAILIIVPMLWSAWEFFTAQVIDDRLYWGVCLIVTGLAQAMLKMWIFQEMNRTSIMREIKRLELALQSQD